MATYDYMCAKDGIVTVVQKMSEAKEITECPICHGTAKRIYGEVPPVHYHTDGFFSTDNFKGDTTPGDKREKLNKAWSAAWGEPPPPADREQPRNKSRQR